MSELRQRLLHRYYVIHSVYGITYIIVLLRRALVSQIPWTVSWYTGNAFLYICKACSCSPRQDSERNAYIALVALSAWKCVMASTAEELTSVLILYTKFFSLCMLYWKTSFWRPLLYIVGWICEDPGKDNEIDFALLITMQHVAISTLFPQPWYQGPTKIEELTEDRFRKQVQRKNAPKITNVEDEPPKYWIVMMYANWSVACLNFEAVLAKLSLEYSADHVKFGKCLYIDIG